MRPSTPQNNQRQEAQQPERPNNQVQRRGKAAVLHKHRERPLAHRGHQRKSSHERKNRHNACQDGEAHPAVGQPDCPARPYALTPLLLEQRVGDDKKREAAMPEHVQPRRGLGSGAEPSGGREHARESERVREGNRR